MGNRVDFRTVSISGKNNGLPRKGSPEIQGFFLFWSLKAVFGDIACGKTRKMFRINAPNIVQWVAGTVIGVTTIVSFPRMIGYLKTIVYILNWASQERNIWFIIMITVTGVIICLLIKNIFRIISAIAQNILLVKHFKLY